MGLVGCLHSNGDLGKLRRENRGTPTTAKIGRYEKRGAVPSADVLAKLAQALNTTADFLMHGSTQDKANAQINDNELLNLFHSVEKMNPEDKSVIKTVIDELVTKRQIQQLAS